jgi:dihydrofolate reductase
VSKIFFDVGVSLDGYIAGPNRGPGNPLGDGGPGHSPVGIPDRKFPRTGAYVMGRHMFDEGERGWPENPPFRAPVFVLTHTPRERWRRKGGTTFFFVTDGIASALEQAKQAAGGKDIHVAPVLLGGGVRLFDQLGPKELELQQVGAIASTLVTHIDYRVAKQPQGAR